MENTATTTAKVWPIMTEAEKAAKAEKRAANLQRQRDYKAARHAVAGVQLGFVIECLHTRRLRFCFSGQLPQSRIDQLSSRFQTTVRIVAAFPARHSDMTALRAHYYASLVSDGGMRAAQWHEPTDELRSAIFHVGYIGPIGAKVKLYLGLASDNGRPISLSPDRRKHFNAAWVLSVNSVSKQSLPLPDHYAAAHRAKGYGRVT